MTGFDLAPATRRLADLVRGVPDDRLDGPTPCPAYALGDLVDHVGGLSVAFALAARKAPEAGAMRASGDAARLGDDWRTRIPEDLAALAEAWRDPAAWEGMTKVGGFEMPGEAAALVTLDEVVIHGWDVAKASGQPFDYDPTLLEAVHGFVSQFSVPGQEAMREGMFGPVVEVPDGAPLLDRIVGMTGRDPGWSPS